MQSNNETENAELVPSQAQGFLALVVAFICVGLALLSPFATRVATLNKGWWVEPKTWPLICLAITISAAILPIRNWARGLSASHAKEKYISQSRWAFGELGTAAEYAGYFCVYLFLMSYVGFALSTLVFSLFVCWRSGLRSPRWQLICIAFVVGTVVSFRVFMQLWFPMPPLFEHFPDWFVQNIAIYL